MKKRILIFTGISALILFLNFLLGTFSAGPGRTVKNLLSHLEAGNLESAAKMFTGQEEKGNSLERSKSELSKSTENIHQLGGIKEVKIEKEDTIGEISTVTAAVVYAKGVHEKLIFNLMKINGEWKIKYFEAASENTTFNPYPNQPQNAVQDVVAWARKERVSDLAAWTKKQRMPLACDAVLKDKESLHDTIKYHPIEPQSLEKRLQEEIKPVLNWFGCENTKGIVFFKGNNILAANMKGGLLAISPDSGVTLSHGYAPDEHIFHYHGKMRFFLARELFRQMLPAEESQPGFSQGDLFLRRELKLNLLATLLLQKIEKNSGLLDHIALDLSLYGLEKSDEYYSTGLQNCEPSLKQIEDIIGAAKQMSM